MRREPKRFAGTHYDVVVVGAGIYGVCIARDAAMRGLHVALVDRGDFGAETSHNSLRLIHGGLRYLQHLDLRRIRESLAERRFWLRAAPHLVRPLKFVMPTYGYGTRGPEAMWAGLRAYGLLGYDRNRGLPSWQHVPIGTTISAKTCAELIPGVDARGLRGGAVWYDGQMIDSDRVLMECVQSACEAGADVCNYVRVEGLLRDGDAVIGVRAHDELAGSEIEIRATTTVNAAGPWIHKLLRDNVKGLGVTGQAPLSKCMNLVTRGLGQEHAFGVVSARASDAVVGKSRRMFFVTPWRGCSIIGTSHLPYRDDPDACSFTDADIRTFLGEVNAAYPAAGLTEKDVLYCHGGLTPSEEEDEQRGEVKRSRSGNIIDHRLNDGIEGLVSVVGVKYTTARLQSERAVDLVFRKRSQTPPPCVAKSMPLPGAVGLETMEKLQREAGAEAGVAMSEPMVELLESFGTQYKNVLEIAQWNHLSGDESDRDELFRRRCQHAVRHEMAVRLPDLIYRRTDLAARGLLRRDLLHWAAELMADELDWSTEQKGRELEDVAGNPMSRCSISVTNGPVETGA
jgi:glycerol-3-phosphate dehydrogenase